MSSPSPGKKRMDTDVVKLIESKYEVTVLGGLNELMVKFNGPPERWNLEGFMNKIFHPNIDEASGTVCLDVINQQWSALYDLTNIFESFLPQLLAYPNPTDPLNSDAASLFMFKPSDYVSKVKEYVQRFATEEALKAEEGCAESSSDDESSMSDYTDDAAQDMEL
ncbi:hypothetical protein AAHC03_0629 [Spirometra sp. Aus1]